MSTEPSELPDVLPCTVLQGFHVYDPQDVPRQAHRGLHRHLGHLHPHTPHPHRRQLVRFLLQGKIWYRPVLGRPLLETQFW